MYRFKKSLIALIGVLTLVGIVTVTVPHIGRGASGTSNNAPTSQTQNVNVVNTPSVNAQQSGTWNVGINGTPTVAVNNFPATSNVAIDSSANTVKIDPTNPLPVRDVDNPARQPFQVEFGFSLSPGELFAEQAFAVPANKRLVIEYISGSSTVPNGQFPGVKITTFMNGTFYNHRVISHLIGTISIQDQYVIGQPLTLYSESQVTISFFRNPSDGSAHCEVALSGHLVDVP